MAVSAETIISKILFLGFFCPGMLKARTSVAASLFKYLLFSRLISLSPVKQTVISAGFMAPSRERSLRIALFILFGWTGIFFWRFFIIIFT